MYTNISGMLTTPNDARANALPQGISFSSFLITEVH